MTDLVTNYLVIANGDLDEFVEEVTDAIKDGWQLFGNLVVVQTGEHAQFYQVIVELDNDR